MLNLVWGPKHRWWRQLKIYYIKSSQILSRLHVLHVTLRLGQNSSAVKINYYKKNIIMGLSRLLKNEWVIYVKSFVLRGHNDAHATNSLFTSNLYIFPYKLVGKLSSQSYNDYDDYEGESSFNMHWTKFWWHILLPNNIPTSTYFFM